MNGGEIFFVMMAGMGDKGLLCSEKTLQCAGIDADIALR